MGRTKDEAHNKELMAKLADIVAESVSRLFATYSVLVNLYVGHRKELVLSPKIDLRARS